jgi:2-oxoglutarate dehydrogenase E2 component (dihydrolipoamide succinyltransferase)
MSDLIPITFSEDQQEGTRAVLSQWLKQPGEFVAANEPLIELETDKVMMEIVAPADGVLKEIAVATGEEVIPGKILGTIEARVRSEDSESTKEDESNSQSRPASSAGAERKLQDSSLLSADKTAGFFSLPFSPAVRRFFQTHQLDPQQLAGQLQGSGKGGRLTVRDLRAYLDSNPILSSTSSPPAEKTPAVNTPRTPIKKPHSLMRRKIAEHMVESLLHTAPHVTSVFNLDMSAIIAHRKQHKKAFAEAGANLTFTAYFLLAAARAAQSVPEVNSRFHADHLEIFPWVNIGVGTALGDEGLVVPVIRDCQDKDLLAIARDLTAMTEKARSGKLTQADMQGGTLTISNHGVSGSLVATPIIINQPQSAILGIGKMEKRVVAEEINGQDVIAVKPMCYVTLTIDHRALDAWHTNRFLTHFVQTLEGWPQPDTA